MVKLFFILVFAFAAKGFAQGACQESEGLRARTKVMKSCLDYPLKRDKELCLEGQRLFYDTALSLDSKASCASCHVKELHYSDDRERPHLRGSELALSRTISLKDLSRRSAPYFWNGRAESLAGAIYWPLYQAQEIGANPAHLERFGGGKAVTAAIASYIKTLNSEDAPIDAYLRGDCKALSLDEEEGLKLFQSSGCVSCHAGSEFAGDEVKPYPYENLPDTYFKNEEARYGQDWQLHASSKGKVLILEVKAPSLRNLPANGPFGQFSQSRNLDAYLKDHLQKIPNKTSLNAEALRKIKLLLTESFHSKEPSLSAEK